MFGRKAQEEQWRSEADLGHLLGKGRDAPHRALATPRGTRVAWYSVDRILKGHGDVQGRFAYYYFLFFARLAATGACVRACSRTERDA